MGVCAILLNSQHQILLSKRKNGYKAGCYGLPGGRIEINEPMNEAIFREVKEETTLAVTDLKYLSVVRENQGDYDFIHFVFVSHVSEAQTQLGEPDKCEGWEWHDVTENLAKVLPGHQAALKMWQNQESLVDITG